MATIPAKAGAPNDVPPAALRPFGLVASFDASRKPLTQLFWEHSRYPSWLGEAASATSGTSRAPSFGTPVPVCQLGFAKNALAPPPVALSELTAVVSFQVVSGIYINAEAGL